MRRFICLTLAVLLLLCGCSTKTEAPKASDEEILQNRRTTAEAQMRHMMSVLWQPDQDITYSTYVNSTGPETDDPSDILHLYADRVYSGMPYTHGSGSGEAFLSFGQPDENGVYQMSGLTVELLSGGGGTKLNNRARLSNDCADAVSWAWSTIGNSFTFTMTSNMVADRGCLPVGEYTTAQSLYKKTRDLCNENGEGVMAEAYAQLQMADAVVTYNGSGHAMMIAQNNSVRTDAGIDMEASYVLVHEQFSSNHRQELTRVDKATGLTVYCLGGVDRKYTYAQLFKKGYLPITIQELIDPAPVDGVDVVDSMKTWNADSVTEGSLNSLYKIASVTIQILDDSDTLLQEATCFTMESEHHMFRMSNFTEPVEQPLIKGSLDLSALTPGNYRCITLCLMGTGETVTVRDFTFDIQ